MVYLLIIVVDDEIGQVLCRKDCLIVYDNDFGIMMIYDLLGSDILFSELVVWLLDLVIGFIKRFIFEEGYF